MATNSVKMRSWRRTLQLKWKPRRDHGILRLPCHRETETPPGDDTTATILETEKPRRRGDRGWETPSIWFSFLRRILIEYKVVKFPVIPIKIYAIWRIFGENSQKKVVKKFSRSNSMTFYTDKIFSKISP